MTKLANDFHCTILKVRTRREKLYFEFDGTVFTKVDAAAFVSKHILSSVPVLIFHGYPPEYSKERAPFYISGHGTEPTSVSVFQHKIETRRSHLRGKDLEARWFNPGDGLIIVGHANPFTAAALRKYRK